MTKEEFEKVKEFLAELPLLRQQVSDTQLLDRCQQALHDLIEALAYIYDARGAEVRNLNLTPEQVEKLRQPGGVEVIREPHYPQPSHIEDVPRDDPPDLSLSDPPLEEPKKKTAKKRTVHHR